MLIIGRIEISYIEFYSISEFFGKLVCIFFKDKTGPSKIRTFFVPKKEYPILELLVGLEFVKSKSEAKRLVTQGGVYIDGNKEIDFGRIIRVKEGMIIQAGKRRFARLTYEQ